LAIDPAARLPNENYFRLGHKHLAPVIEDAEKERMQECLTKIISVWGINISLQLIAVAEKRRVAIQTFSQES
jgi:hypothetical protein